MDMNALDVGTVLALLGVIFKVNQDKAAAAEEVGRMKQQIKSLESRMGQVDNKFSDIDDKLGKLIASMTRLETLLGHQGQPRVMETPGPLRNG